MRPEVTPPSQSPAEGRHAPDAGIEAAERRAEAPAIARRGAEATLWSTPCLGSSGGGTGAREAPSQQADEEVTRAQSEHT